MGHDTDSADHDFLAELRWRGLLHQTAGEEVARHVGQASTAPRIAYVGFDPTAEALTIGNFIQIKLLAHWQRCGHRPIVLMGGGTGLIGDPSGKSAERQLLDAERVAANVEAQRPTFARVLDFSESASNRAVILNNLDWLGPIGYLEMLRDVGKHFSVNQMIQRDSVAARLNSREQGISYTEFSYVLLQAYDFLHLFRTRSCTVQLGGSDQYGNIVSGMDLIRRMAGGEAFGVTTPLVANRDGTKIGKSERGAIYLDASRTSPFAFHQFWLNVADDEVGRYLRFFTFLDEAEVLELEAAHAAAPQERAAQRRLAALMTELFHGVGERARAELAAAALFSGDVRSLDARSLREVASELPGSVEERAALAGEGVPLADVLVRTALVTSKREAREFLAAGAISVNGERIEPEHRLTASDLLHGETTLLRRGRKHWHAVAWR
ncbi:MAG TPA: tyrosine--tRNA ligase [Phycisphaerales bacterium]|nr:tyrosine--tRNA ligase [Phycisphaerales bacterium]HMP37680.1 tyrosine--tRNA ligase [Phycisphaerales bacterium]